jgi:hypothetical protein
MVLNLRLLLNITISYIRTVKKGTNGRESERSWGLRTGKPEKTIIAVLKGESSIIS